VSVVCEIFDDYDQKIGRKERLEETREGCWQLSITEDLTGKWYGYYVEHPDKLSIKNPYRGELFADPYSKHVTVINRYDQQAKTFIFSDDFDWEGDKHIFPDDPRDLVIYETHLKDLTAHPSSKSDGEGFYNKFINLEPERWNCSPEKTGC